jgi:spermidine synthase
MLPWEPIATATAPDGTPLALVRRGDEWVVRVAGQTLMSSRQQGSEEALARIALGHRPGARRVLVGGLGLGYTARAALDLLPQAAEPTETAETSVEIAELVPELIEWNRTHTGALAGHPLRDPRVVVFAGDVQACLRARTGDQAFDVIVLDVDNGPTAVAHETNNTLYQASGIRACFGALRPGGVLAVWSTGPHPAYENRLGRAGFRASTESVPVRHGKRGGTHTIFVGRKPGSTR